MKGKWNLVRISSGHLSCENASLESRDIVKVEEIIEEHFGVGILNRKNILVYWDWCAGVYIMPNILGEASMSKGDKFVKEIYEFLKNSENSD